jgi:hypothetical protein
MGVMGGIYSGKIKEHIHIPEKEEEEEEEDILWS